MLLYLAKAALFEVCLLLRRSDGWNSSTADLGDRRHWESLAGLSLRGLWKQMWSPSGCSAEKGNIETTRDWCGFGLEVDEGLWRNSI